MKIAVLSGKGGAGKTMVATNLARVMNYCYVDCDVEEPNGNLFFKSEFIETKTVYNQLPIIDMNLCNACRKCADFCAFNALAFIRNQPMLFPGICHSCGGCKVVCPQNAIDYQDHAIGKINIGRSLNNQIITGEMNTNEESGIKIIKDLNYLTKDLDNVIYDCPPGSACSVMENVENADFCILVIESTAFGFHNFCMVHELVKIMHKPCAVIINKYESEYPPLTEYLEKEKLDVLLTLNFDLKLSKLISDAKLVVDEDEGIKERFNTVANKLRSLAL